MNIEGKDFVFCSPMCATLFSLRKDKADELVDIDSGGVSLEKLKDCGLMELFEETLDKKASDLHVSVGTTPTLRVNGNLVKLGGSAMSEEAVYRYIDAITSAKQKENLLKGSELDLSLEIPQLDIRFRINIYKEMKGPAISLRIIPKKIKSISELKLPEVLEELAMFERGLIIVTGPAGCGKSTSLAAMIEHINTNRKCHIITIEDPIEYAFEDKKSIIHQREVGTHTKSFQTALRSALREDQNVIMLGEMRDLESISLAIRAAETGHLVLTTLHSGRAVQAISRVVDVFASNQQLQVKIQLAESLVAIMAQTLLPRADKKGRIVATEVLIANDAIRNLVREGYISQIPNVIQTSKKHGMHTFNQSFEELLSKGLINRSDIPRISS